MDSATVKFQRALPFCVFPVSSQLAALHAVSQSSPVPDSCKSCGSYLSTHVTVVRNRQHSRVIKTTCNACGRIHSTPLHKGNSTIFPSRKQHASVPYILPNPIPDISLPLLSTNQSSTTLTPAAGTPKPSKALKNNKKSGLHDMLKKNREREQKRAETSSGGLSAFLTTL